MIEIIGIISVLLAVVSYGLYIFNTVKGRTRPHAMTWLIWGGLNGFVFFEQVAAGAGAGAWVTGGAAIANAFIFLLALHYGERNITRFDWFVLGLVGLLLLIWARIQDPTLSVLLAVTIFLAGFIPTLVKASKNAFEETALTYALNGTKFFLSFLALSTVTVVTAVYPLTLFVVNVGFAVYLVLARRRMPARLRRKAERAKRR